MSDANRKRTSGSPLNGATSQVDGDITVKEYQDILPNQEGEVVIEFVPLSSKRPESCGVSGIVIRSSS